MMIKIFLANVNAFSPFRGYHPVDIPYLNAHNVEVVENVQSADVIVSQNRKHLLKYMRKYLTRKQYLLWTNEPRFDTYTKSLRKELFGFVKLHVMNLYTKDVFVSPLSFHGHLFARPLQKLPENFELKNRKIVGLMSYFQGLNMDPVYIDGVNRDLISKRTAIALYGNTIEGIHIYGKGWPDGISIEDSRKGAWVQRKAEILSKYHFNLCFENTATFNYVTEKIWDSITHYCLPIYYGKHTGIYKIFPQDSFLDYANFNTPEALFEYINKMTVTEYTQRMNACIEVYENIRSKNSDFLLGERKLMLEAIATKMKEITI